MMTYSTVILVNIYFLCCACFAVNREVEFHQCRQRLATVAGYRSVSALYKQWRLFGGGEG